MAKKKSSSPFRGSVSKDVSRQKSRGSSYGYLNLPQGINVWSPEPGSKNVLLDFLPYPLKEKNHPDIEGEYPSLGDLWYKRPFFIHRNVGVNNDSVVCPKSIGKKCPICDYRDQLFKDGASKDDTDAVKAKSRNLYIVVPLNSDKHDKVPHILDMSQYLFQDKLNDELEEDEANEIFPDLKEGLTLKVRFSSEVIGSGKPYAEVSRIDFEKRKKQYSEKILKKVPDLDSVLQILPYDQLNSKFQEIEDVAEEETQKETTKKEKSKRKKKELKNKKDSSEKSEKKKKKEKKPECPEGWKFGSDYMKKKKICKKCALKKECEVGDLPF